MGLTKKQKQIYDFICQYIKENNYSPTQTEIQRHFALKSLGSVQDYIKYLTNAGYLESSPNAVRGLTPVKEASTPATDIEIPLLGKVAAGSPIEAITNDNSIAVPPTMLKRGANYFALEVVGDSMIEDGILEGDVLVVKNQKNAEQGQTVIALINNEATVKKLYTSDTTITLHPANSSMRPIVIKPGENFTISGIVVGLLRHL